jgi:hypothetical protein
VKVLVACEESQTVALAFRDLGHDAYSCDILPCSGGFPAIHLQGDVSLFIGKNKYNDFKGWDLMIAHPPCTYLTNAGAVHLYPKGVLNEDRKKKGDEAKKLFMLLLNADIPLICVENPIPSKIYGLPKYDQTIQPYEYGHPYKKKTCLWLKGLPKLIPTNIVEIRESTKIAGNWFNKGGMERQKNRSKTFKGIAEAFAKQWGDLK